jgi:CRP/FNR family transcriptional regulator, cyclic AMP receptor protein
VSLNVYVKGQPAERHAAGSVIFELGDPGSTMYVVGEGDVELRYAGSSVRVGPGDSFGEMAIIDKRPRSATAIAVTDVELHPINQGLFLVLVHETPLFALEVMRSLSERLRRANEAQAGA